MFSIMRARNHNPEALLFPKFLVVFSSEHRAATANSNVSIERKSVNLLPRSKPPQETEEVLVVKNWQQHK